MYRSWGSGWIEYHSLVLLFTVSQLMPYKLKGQGCTHCAVSPKAIGAGTAIVHVPLFRTQIISNHYYDLAHVHKCMKLRSIVITSE